MSKGFKPDSIDEAIEEYEELNVFSVNQAKTKLTFVDVNWAPSPQDFIFSRVLFILFHNKPSFKAKLLNFFNVKALEAQMVKWNW